MNDNAQHETIRPLTDQEIDLIGGGNLLSDIKQIISATADIIKTFVGGLGPKPNV